MRLMRAAMTAGFALMAIGCGCKRPSVIAQPEIVSYTLEPASPERLNRMRAGLSARAGDPAALDELVRAQESLRTAPADSTGFLSRQICPLVGQPGEDCVKAVRPIGGGGGRPDAFGGVAPPEQYLICLKKPVPVDPKTRAGSLLPPLVTEAGGLLRPNVRWRLREPTPPSPKPDEKLAKECVRRIESRDWALKQIDYRGALARLEAKRAGQGPGQGVVIAQLDTGFTPSCQLQKEPGTASLVLASQLGFDYFACQDEPADPLTEALLPFEARQPGHGTGTSTVLASPNVPPQCHPHEPLDSASGKPIDRVVGIAPAATVIPVRVSDGIILGFPAASKGLLELQGVSFDARMRALVAGMFHAMEKDASVISISMGGVCADDEAQRRSNEDLQRYMAEAERRGIIIVAAAGQFPIPGFLRRLFFDDYPVTFPGSFPSTVAVAASSVFGRPWTQSSRGAKVDVTAPGFGVWRAKPRLKGGEDVDEVDVGDGTSFSTAITAGVAALWVQYWGKDWLRERYGPATAAAFRLALHRSAQQPSDLARRLQGEPYAADIERRVRPWNRKEFGAGLLDAARLLDVDMAKIGRDEVCHAEAARLGAKADPVWKAHQDRICARSPSG